MCDHLAMYVLIFYRDCEKAFSISTWKRLIFQTYICMYMFMYMYHLPYTPDDVQHPSTFILVLYTKHYSSLGTPEQSLFQVKK